MDKLPTQLLDSWLGDSFLSNWEAKPNDGLFIAMLKPSQVPLGFWGNSPLDDEFWGIVDFNYKQIA